MDGCMNETGQDRNGAKYGNARIISSKPTFNQFLIWNSEIKWYFPTFHMAM